MRFCMLFLHANQNRINPDKIALIKACAEYKRLTGDDLLRPGWEKRPKDPRTIGQFLWFANFELSFVRETEKRARERRKELKVVS